MTDITLINSNGEARVDSRQLAEQLGNKHRHSIRLVDKYLERFKRFGQVCFENADGKRQQGGGKGERYALLNEDQAYFLLSLSRNTDEVVDLKANLVMAFRRAREEAALSTMFGHVLLPDAASWEKRFMDGFYQSLGKMTGMPFNGHSRGTPPLFARITRDWVYRVALDERAYEEAKARCRPGEKIHQWLSHGALKAVELQLINITALASACIDYQDFVARCTHAYGKPGQLRLVYPAA
ncbi:Rha family transcriptional regulator [Vreelandella titanicae]|uniref:Rha family transcriptional regulator n=1 Tax=Vreelandella titanicae TaxID=664683 RepID=UPI00381CC032